MQPTVVQPVIAQLLSQYPPGSAVHKAVEYGIDITLLIENLKLTPTQRLRRAEQICKSWCDFKKSFNAQSTKHVPRH
ncbi:MAG: hypothetical protein HC853_02220 [Anaerolineae bacterium]|nr:hypothetical protein [Anaerolineae bacterium]